MSASGKDEQRETTTFIDAESFEDYGGELLRLLTRNKNTILHIYLNMASNRSTEFISKVVDKCPSLVGQINDNGDTPLHIAARLSHSEAAELLIRLAKKPFENDPENGTDPVAEARKMIRALNKQKDTALHEAARCNSHGVVGAILAAEDLIEFAYCANDRGETPLYLAANHQWNSLLVKILEACNNQLAVAYGGPNGKTALHAALMRNDLYAVCELVQKMNNLVNEADEYGWTSLHYSAFEEEGLISISSNLLAVDKSVAYVKDKDWKRTALHIAACRGNASIMRRIISECPDCCELTDIRGWNVLHYAAINDSDEILKEVLKDPSLIYLANAKDVSGYTPFHLLLYKSRYADLYIRLRNIVGTDVNNSMLFQILEFVAPAIHPSSQNKEEIRRWIEDIGDGQFGQIFVKNWREIETEREEKVIPGLEKAKDSYLVAAALVATVTFAAAFTLPGGYVSDESEPNQQGTPILSTNSAFKAFVISDAIAMVLSTVSVFIHYMMAIVGYKRRYFWLMRSSLGFILLAMGAMVVAFVTGTYAVLASSPGLFITTCLIGLSFFLYLFCAILKLCNCI